MGVIPATAIHEPRRGSVSTAQQCGARTKLQGPLSPPVESSDDSSTAQALPLNVQSPGTMHQPAGHPPGRHHNDIWFEALGRWSHHRLIHLQRRKVPCVGSCAARHTACRELNGPTGEGCTHVEAGSRAAAAGQQRPLPGGSRAGCRPCSPESPGSGTLMVAPSPAPVPTSPTLPVLGYEAAAARRGGSSVGCRARPRLAGQ